MKYARFDMYLIYGYYVELPDFPKDDPGVKVPSEIERDQKSYWNRKMWVPPYDLNHDDNMRSIWQQLQGDWSAKIHSNFKGTHSPNLSIHYSHHGEKHAYNITGLDCMTTTGGWGPGSFTLHLSVTPDEGKLLTTGDLLRIMHILPRVNFLTPEESRPRASVATINEDAPDKLLELGRSLMTFFSTGIDTPPDGFNITDEDDSKKNSEIWQYFSIPFKLFVSWAYSVYGDKWNEFPGFYGKNGWFNDPQIPYIFVTASLPDDLFDSAFRQNNPTDYVLKSKVRSKYTKEIGAILGRFIEEKNIYRVNTDYYYQRYRMENDSFISQHRDSQIFILVSPIVGLAFFSDGEEEPYPSSISKDSVLAYLEFSRLRWHHILWANRALDRILYRIRFDCDTIYDLYSIMGELSEIRFCVVQSLNNPLEHIWSTMVASDLPDQFEREFLEQFEKTTIQKFEMIDKLVTERDRIQRSSTVRFKGQTVELEDTDDTST